MFGNDGFGDPSGGNPAYITGSPAVAQFSYQHGWEQPAIYGDANSVSQPQVEVPNVQQTAPVQAVQQVSPQVIYGPPSGHLPSGVPQQGHTPYFTSPMDRGGPNMPAYALPEHTPFGIDQQAGVAPLPGAYAGVAEYGAAATIDYARPFPGTFRDVQGSGGWVYRQFKDGAIQIVVSQHASLPVGTLMRGVSPQDPLYRNWTAVTQEIGLWSDYARARTASIAKSAVDAALQVTTAATQSQRRKGKRKTATPAPVVTVVPEVQGEPGFFDTMPRWMLYGGAALLVGGTLWLATRPSAKK